MSRASEGRTRDVPLDLTADSEGDESTENSTKSGRSRRTAIGRGSSQRGRLNRGGRKMGMVASRPGISSLVDRSSAKPPSFDLFDGDLANGVRPSPVRPPLPPSRNREPLVDLTQDDDEEPMRNIADAIERRSATAKIANGSAMSGDGSQRQSRSESGTPRSRKRPRDGDDGPEPKATRFASDRKGQPASVFAVLKKTKSPEKSGQAADSERNLLAGETNSDKDLRNDALKEELEASEVLPEPRAKRPHSAALVHAAANLVTQPNGRLPGIPGDKPSSADGSRQNPGPVASRAVSEELPFRHFTPEGAFQSTSHAEKLNKSGSLFGTLSKRTQNRTGLDRFNATPQQNSPNGTAPRLDASMPIGHIVVREAQEQSAQTRSSASPPVSLFDMDQNISGDPQPNQQHIVKNLPGSQRGRFKLSSLFRRSQPADSDELPQDVQLSPPARSSKSAVESKAIDLHHSEMANLALSTQENSRESDTKHENDDSDTPQASSSHDTGVEYSSEAPNLAKLFRKHLPMGAKTRPQSSGTHSHDRSQEIAGIEARFTKISKSRSVSAITEKSLSGAANVHRTRETGPSADIPPPRDTDSRDNIVIEAPQPSIETDGHASGVTSNSFDGPKIESNQEPQNGEDGTVTDHTLRTANRSGRARINPRLEFCSMDNGGEEDSEKISAKLQDSTAVDTADAATGRRGQGHTSTLRGGKSNVMGPPASRVISDDAVLVDRVIQEHLTECRSDNDYWHSIWLKKGRLAAISAPAPAGHEKPTSVFKKMKPLQGTTTGNTNDGEETASLRFEVLEHGKSTRTETTICCDTFGKLHSRDVDLPKYQHYVSIKNNFLANNETILQHWPYFGDDVDLEDCTNLRELYFLDIAERQRKLECMLKAERLADYADGMLAAIDCKWEDVLRFLLDPTLHVGTDPSALQALRKRDDFCTEDFLRTGEVSTTVLSALPTYEPAAVGRAAIFCQRFHELTRLQPWHIARRCDFVKICLAEANADDQETSTCRICLRYHCPSHGEISESQNGNSSMPSEAADDVDETDVVNARKVNFRQRVECPPSVESQDVIMPRKERTDWAKSDYNMKHEDRGPYYPCHHPGKACDEAHCICWTTKTPCEKMCSCPSDCKRRWQGCSCRAERAKKGQKLVCFEDSRCVCYQNSRECDADLCGDCGVCDVLDPVNRYNDDAQIGHCHNASIQRGVPKRTLIGTSGVHGLGLYSGDYTREHEFVGEYRGEVITKEEAERRGAVNEHQKLSYLFSLNKTQEIDSTYFGNKVRFINHAHDSKANLYPRIVFVNTQHRIGLYSRRRIKPGEELFFDYGPQFPDTQLGGPNKTSKKSAPQKANKSIPHVRNAQLTRDFIDVEYENDALGNRRAVKVGQAGKRPGARGRGRPRVIDDDDDDDSDDNEADGAADEEEQPEAFETSPEADENQHPDAGQRLDFYLSNETDRMLIDDDDDDANDEFQPDDSESVSEEDNDAMQDDSDD